MVLTLMIPMRALFKLEEIITVRHLELMCKVIMATGSIVGYAYGMEFFIAWYGANPYEGFAFINRAVVFLAINRACVWQLGGVHALCSISTHSPPASFAIIESMQRWVISCLLNANTTIGMVLVMWFITIIAY